MNQDHQENPSRNIVHEEHMASIHNSIVHSQYSIIEIHIIRNQSDQ